MNEILLKKTITEIKFYTDLLAMKKEMDVIISAYFTNNIHIDISKSDTDTDTDTYTDSLSTDTTISEKISDNDTLDVPQYMKTIYKSIVKETHPDKVINKEDIFIKAVNAMETLNYLDMLIIADNLNIPIKYEDLDIDTINTEITHIKKESDSYDNKLSWKYYYTKDPKYLAMYLS